MVVFLVVICGVDRFERCSFRVAGFGFGFVAT